MNDFTKEELIELLVVIDGYVNEDRFMRDGEGLYIPIVNKIQSMLENYCEHDYKKTLSKSGMYFISMCHKCKKYKPYVSDTEE